MNIPGKERDSESGLDYFGARYYGSALGRFTSPDWSVKPEPVPYADLSNPQSLNFYSYVLNNPLSKPDRDGHVAGVDDLVEGAIIVGVGATIAVTAYIEQPENQKSLTAAVSTAVDKIGSAIDSIVHSSSNSNQKNAPPAPADATPTPTTAPAVPGTPATDQPRSLPLTGTPGTTATLPKADGSPKQVRRYGPDGTAQTDVDHTTHHGPQVLTHTTGLRTQMANPKEAHPEMLDLTILSLIHEASNV